VTKWSRHSGVSTRKLSGRGLGRRVPTDDNHVLRFPLAALPQDEQPTGVPVVLGINWYTNFDNPVRERDGRWWIGRGDLGGDPRRPLCRDQARRRRPRRPDLVVGVLRPGPRGRVRRLRLVACMSLLNRKRYYARWLWDQAKLIDDWADTNPGDDNGTSVRAAMEVLRIVGHIPWRTEFSRDSLSQRDARRADATDGITAYRWATDTADVLRMIDMPLATRLGAVPILNSWGKDYPHIVWMPGETLERLHNEDGEVAVITDR
jgi:hypothetical protein